MTSDELRAIRERCEAATPGPWHPEIDDDSVAYRGCGPSSDSWDQMWTDAAFIAAARTDVPALLDEVERLREEVMAANRDWHGMSAEVERLTRERDEARAIANAAVRELNEANARAAMADQLSGKPGGFES